MISAPIRVELVPHLPLWAGQASLAASKMRRVLRPVCIAVHHIGSTSIPGSLAKPTVDLVAIATNLAAVDAVQHRLARHGYHTRGEYGIVGRRCLSLEDSGTEQRAVQLHAFEAGYSASVRMIAFCAYLHAHPEQARRYERVKQDCSAHYRENSTDYARAKDGWIRSLDAAMEAWWRSCQPST